jgi:hypothetical protein
LHTGFDISGKSEAELFDAARGMGIDVDATMGKGKLKWRTKNGQRHRQPFLSR